MNGTENPIYNDKNNTTHAQAVNAHEMYWTFSNCLLVMSDFGFVIFTIREQHANSPVVICPTRDLEASALAGQT